jgi:hypothetical protein
MGNWRRVEIIGTCSPADVEPLRRALTYDQNTLDGFHCLVNGGLCGLPNWAAERIHAVGNLAERDYSPGDVAFQLIALGQVAPSLAVRVHCGADYEKEECIATVTLVAGTAVVGPGLKATIPTQDQETMRANVIAQLSGRAP